MNLKQNEIYEGLKSIGEEIASFYADGVNIINSDFKTKSYLTAHISREIEGGLRDVFAPKVEEEIKICSKCEQPTKKRISHRQSIIEALGNKDESELSKEWYKIAKKFHKYAHRHGAWKAPRGEDEFVELWFGFENVLLKLLGNYFAIEERLEHIMKIDVPTNEILGTLPNLLEHHARYVYFFNNLKSSKWLKPLFDNGFFKGSDNPSPIEVDDNKGYFTIPYWAVLSYLKEIAEKNYATPINEVTNLLVSILDDIINYRNTGNERIENYHTDYSLIQIIGFLPKSEIKDEYFDFIKLSLTNRFDNSVVASEIGRSLLKRFISNREEDLILKTFHVILSYRKAENDIDLQPLISELWFKETIKQDRGDLLKLMADKIFDLGISYIKEISKKYPHSFNNTEIPTIENHTQTMFPEKYVCQLVYLVRDALINIQEPEINNKLHNLIGQNEICNRLSIFAINYKYDSLSEIFWNWDNPLNEPDCKHEIFELISNHSKKFSEKEIDLVLKWIEEKEYRLYDTDKEDKELAEKIIAYRKKEWLTALLKSENSKVKAKFENYNQLNSSKVEHPGFNGWHSGLIGVTSPLTKDDILSKSLTENIDFFISFSKEKQEFLGPSIDGLSSLLIEAIKENPIPFIFNCNDIIDAPIYFSYSWLRGINECWQSGYIFKVAEIFDTILGMLQKSQFWINNNEQKRAYEDSFIVELLRFIENGLRDDKRSFDTSNLSIIKKIILLVLENDKREVSQRDEISSASLNTSKGKTYSAIIEYSLKIARGNKENKDKWDEEIISKIENAINSNTTNELLFFTLVNILEIFFLLPTKGQ